MFRLFIKPVFWWAKKVYRYIALPLYRFGLRLRKRFEKSFGPAKNKIFYPLIAKPVLHIVVIVLIFGVTATNLQAHSAPNSGGQGSILFQAVGGETLELIEETADQSRSAQVTSYLGTSYGLSQRNAIQVEAAIPVAESTALVTTGGSSIATTPSITGSIPTGSNVPRKVRTRNETYIVQGGDTLSTIAAAFGLSTTTILWANDLGARDYIKPGQELLILPDDGVEVEVDSGDTISKLAKNYDVEEAVILSANKLSEDDALVEGRTVFIPGGTPPRPVAPTPVIVQRPSISNITNIVTQKPSASPEAGSPSMVWPTSGRVITQYWGWKHTGVDIDGHYDSPIYASDGGIVEVAGWGNGYGLQIVVNHENGFKTRYAHASKIFVSVGQRVSKGEVMAMVGTTGFSTGTHLHYEVYVNGTRKNPLLYVR